MAHEVFISYSKPDKVVADAVCGTLEAKGVRCWIAPRDVEPGCEWSASIVEALGVCRVMVLVFSSHANESPHVRREVQRAFGNSVTVIPFRVENVRPVKSLEYYLGPVHWLDALTTPLERHLDQLVDTVHHILAVAAPDAKTDSPTTESTASPPDAGSPKPARPRPVAPPVERANRRPPQTDAEPDGTHAPLPAPAVPAPQPRRSPGVTLGIAALAAFTIVGVAFAMRWERSRGEPLDPGHVDSPEVPERTTTHSTATNAPVVTGKALPPQDDGGTWRPITTVTTGSDTGTGKPVVFHDLDAVIQPDADSSDDATVATPEGIPPEILRQLLAQAGQGAPGTVTEARILMRSDPVAIQADMNSAEGDPPVAGEGWIVPGLNLEMLYVRPSSFRMGSPAGEKQRQDNEGPTTRVNLTEGFWLGTYEVTLGQWLALMHEPTSLSSDNADRDTPVELVTWSDAMEFCAAMNSRERAAHRLPADYVYALPTEAQWEYACRAGTTTPFHCGGRLTPNDANFDATESYGGAARGRSSEGLVPVGQYPPNEWGFYDLHGNAWEWTSSGITQRHPGGAVDDYETPAPENERVMRGGSWVDPAASCRSAMRSSATENVATSGYGFRLALVRER